MNRTTRLVVPAASALALLVLTSMSLDAQPAAAPEITGLRAARWLDLPAGPR